MSASSLRRPLLRQSGYICERCSLRLQSPRFGRRWESTNSPATQAKAPKSVLDVLEQRGYLNQIAGTRDDLHRAFSTTRIGAYVGIDPTASSMHVGHLIPFMALFWLYLYGHKAITLVGGGTASVGDPTGRVKARPHLLQDTRKRNMQAIEVQLQRIWWNVSTLGKKYGQGIGDGESKLLNNDEWLRRTNILDVLGTVGAGLRMGAMLGRDTVKTRMTAEASSQNEGMSFAEFCYPVLQAWDWWVMFRDHDVTMQIGGSDQYGNILSGIDGIKYALKLQEDATKELPTPLGFTVPLLTTPSGEKFGKSAGNAIWLDKEQTSTFDLYGFFVGLPDSEVEKLLNFFTFLPQLAISQTMRQHVQAPERRIAQHLLAREFVELVHGREDAEAAQEKHLSRSGVTRGPTVPTGDLKLPRSEVIDQPYSFLIHAAGLAETRSKAAKLVESGGAYLIDVMGHAAKIERGTAVNEDDVFTVNCGSQGQDQKFLMLRAGKWKTRTIELV